MVMKHQDIHAHFDKLESTKYILLEGKAVLLDSFDRRNHFTTSGRVVGEGQSGWSSQLRKGRG